MDDGGVGVLVAEGHVAELHLALDLGQGGGLAGFVLHLLGLQELEDPLPRGGGGLEGLDRLGDLGQGLGEVPDVQHEGHDDPEADGVVEGHGAPHHADGHIAEVADEAHNGHH